MKILLGCIFTYLFFQSDLDRVYKAFLDRQLGKYDNLGEFEGNVKKKDFSKLWTTNALPANDYTGSIRPEPLGIIGASKRRLHMHLEEVVQTTEFDTYKVVGKSKVGDNICDFTGQLKIEIFREFKREYREGGDYVLDPRTVRTGVIVGTYILKEDETQSHAGVFEGNFVSSFYLSESGEIEYCVAEIFSDNFINNQFTGIWTPYESDQSKICNWGDFRIPDAGDLDMGAGGFSPSDKYLNVGWKTYRQAYFEGDKASRAIEEKEWWKD